MWRSISEMVRLLITVIQLHRRTMPSAPFAPRSVIAAVAGSRRGRNDSVRVGIATGSVLVGDIIGPDTNPERGAVGEARTSPLACRLWRS
jgi:hypothetical protein